MNLVLPGWGASGLPVAMDGNKRRGNLGLGKPLTTKSRKRYPQPTKQRTEQIWTVSGQYAGSILYRSLGKNHSLCWMSWI
jgi:hypothetical protein